MTTQISRRSNGSSYGCRRRSHQIVNITRFCRRRKKRSEKGKSEVLLDIRAELPISAHLKQNTNEYALNVSWSDDVSLTRVAVIIGNVQNCEDFGTQKNAKASRIHISHEPDGIRDDEDHPHYTLCEWYGVWYGTVPKRIMVCMVVLTKKRRNCFYIDILLHQKQFG